MNDEATKSLLRSYI